jgi:Na+/H+ antiporter NhaC
MNVYDSEDCFFYGVCRVVPATIVLTLAWASGSIMGAVGIDSWLFTDWISDGLAPAASPTLSFLISFFMAVATATSWGTMVWQSFIQAILFPLLMGPTYTVPNGSAVIFYSTIAGILSGAITGDHVSPISDTTVFTALATDSDLLKHVDTQSPYALWIIFFSTNIGTLPVGWVGLMVGVPTMILLSHASLDLQLRGLG